MQHREEGKQELVRVRPVEKEDKAVWMEMWSGFNMFYGVSLPEEVTAVTWARVLDPASMVKSLLATNESGQALGFANYVLHPYTWGERPVCYLEDLFVRPEVRGQGTGRALIEHLLHMAQEQSWDRLYWVTDEDNSTARKLYDRFSPNDGVVRYTIKLR